MLNWIIPAAIGLFGALRGGGGGGGTGGTGGTGVQVDPMLQQLLPYLSQMSQNQANFDTGLNPLRQAVANQAFLGLPSWARTGIPGVDGLNFNWAQQGAAPMPNYYDETDTDRDPRDPNLTEEERRRRQQEGTNAPRP